MVPTQFLAQSLANFEARCLFPFAGSEDKNKIFATAVAQFTKAWKYCVQYLQGRFLTLIRFFDSDQKQIENIYRYQI
jgi:hypothetical protein